MSLSRANDREITISGNRHLRLRAIGAEDEAALVAMSRRPSLDTSRLAPVVARLEINAHLTCSDDQSILTSNGRNAGYTAHLIGFGEGLELAETRHLTGQRRP